MTKKISLLAFFSIAALLSARAQSPSDRADWLRQAHWGMIGYNLAEFVAESDDRPMTVQRWNDHVDQIDVEAVAAQLQELGAGYYIITVGQKSGYFLAPNPVYDQLTGSRASKCSKRDLVADLSAALQPRGIKLIVFLSAQPPLQDKAAVKALGYQGTQDHNRAFQLKWEQVIRSWSQHWGTKVAGWYFENCNFPNLMYRSPEAPNFTSFAAAARAGNPAAIVAFNPGIFNRVMSITPEEDYIGGEVLEPQKFASTNMKNGKIDGVQVQIISGLGTSHGKGPPLFSTAQVVEFSRRVTKLGGAITWDAPLQPDGTIGAPYAEQLAAVGRALAKPASPPAAQP